MSSGYPSVISRNVMRCQRGRRSGCPQGRGQKSLHVETTTCGHALVDISSMIQRNQLLFGTSPTATRGHCLGISMHSILLITSVATEITFVSTSSASSIPLYLAPKSVGIRGTFRPSRSPAFLRHSRISSAGHSCMILSESLSAKKKSAECCI
jgi:hypothetical protein